MLRQVAAMWAYRHFVLALVRLDVRRRYTRSFVGAGWSVLHPLAMTLVFAVVFSNLLGADPRTYLLFLLLGMVVWNFFKECAVGGCLAMISHETYIRQSPLPYGLYPLRLVLSTAVHSGIALLAALGLVVVMRWSLEPLGILWAVLPALGLAVAAGWAVASIASCVQVYFHDTQHLLEVAAQIGFFLTPIMYGPELLVNKGLGGLVAANPVNLFLELVRTPVLHGTPPPAFAYLYAAGGTAVLVGLASAALAWSRKRLVFRL